MKHKELIKNLPPVAKINNETPVNACRTPPMSQPPAALLFPVVHLVSIACHVISSNI